MKILLIIPPNMEYDRFANPGFNERVTVKKTGKYGSPITDMPLGVISLSAYLHRYAGMTIQLIDFNVLLNQLDNFEYASFLPFYRNYLSPDCLHEEVPDIVGISTLFTTGYRNMIDLANLARDMFPNALIVAGGGVPTNLYQRIFAECESFDALCFGEGEKPLLALATADDKKVLLKNHPSWITKEKVERGISFQYDFIQNLDEIPFYDYGLLDLDAYMLSPTLTNYAAFQSSSHLFHYATSRGCPYRCCFCASHTVHGRKMRNHSIDRVREDFIQLRDRFGARIINFQDDHLMSDKKRVHTIIHIANELNLQLYFQNGINMRCLDRKMLEAMKSAGVKDIVLPIESGSNRVLKEIMHKPIDLNIVKRVVDDCRQLGIETDANILIGLPGETKQDIEEARLFLKSLDANWFRIVVATPLVGSEMYKICREKNYISGNDIACDYKTAVVNTEDFTAEYIVRKAYLLNLEINFVGNSDVRLGHYENALERFENTIRVKEDHAFAYYFAAACCRKIGLEEKYAAYKERYQELIAQSAMWKDYASRFKLPALC